MSVSCEKCDVRRECEAQPRGFVDCQDNAGRFVAVGDAVDISGFRGYDGKRYDADRATVCRVSAYGVEARDDHGRTYLLTLDGAARFVVR